MPIKGNKITDIFLIEFQRYLKAKKYFKSLKRLYSYFKAKKNKQYQSTYSATDTAGNVTTADAEVRVPHDQSGMALAWSGYTDDGTELIELEPVYQVLIPWSGVLDASNIDAGRAYVGNDLGVQTPVAVETFDYNQDGLSDLLLTYDAELTRMVRSGSEFAVGLYYQTLEGTFYAVPDVFLLGPPARPGPTRVRDAPCSERPTRLQRVRARRLSVPTLRCSNHAPNAKMAR